MDLTLTVCAHCPITENGSVHATKDATCSWHRHHMPTQVVFLHLARNATIPLETQATMCRPLCLSRSLLTSLLPSRTPRSTTWHASGHVHTGVVQVIGQPGIARLVDLAPHVTGAGAAERHDRIFAVDNLEDGGVEDRAERSKERTVADAGLPEHVRGGDVKARLGQVVHAEHRLRGTQAMTCDCHGMTAQTVQSALDLPSHRLVTGLEAGPDPASGAAEVNESGGGHILQNSCHVSGAPESNNAGAAGLAHGRRTEVARVGQRKASVAIQGSAHSGVEMLPRSLRRGKAAHLEGRVLLHASVHDLERWNLWGCNWNSWLA